MYKIKTAYKRSQYIYDDVLTQNKWWSKLYINLFWGVDDNKLAETLLCFIPDGFNGRLLDVPVGTGVFTAQIYKKFSHANITCIDYSDAMLDKARAIFTQHGLSHVKCQQGDVGNLPFPDNRFDIALSMNGFHAFPEKQKAFKETARVLKKGGAFIGCFYIKGKYKPSDFVVKTVLSKKGWFTPPFQTKEELQMTLESMYSEVNLYQEKAMAWFKCVK